MHGSMTGHATQSPTVPGYSRGIGGEITDAVERVLTWFTVAIWRARPATAFHGLRSGISAECRRIDQRRTSVRSNTEAESDGWHFHNVKFSRLALEQKGRDYSRPTTGTGMPSRERFRHARVRACFQRCLLVELPVS